MNASYIIFDFIIYKFIFIFIVIYYKIVFKKNDTILWKSKQIKTK